MEAEEESLENLTGSLPPMAGESPATPQSGTRRPFDVAIWNRREAARRNAAKANSADRAPRPQAGQPAAQPQQAYTQPGTATYPIMQRAEGCTPKRAAHPKLLPRPPSVRTLMWTWGRMLPSALCRNAVQHDPLQKIDIGPSGTLALTRWSS